jgi:tetratricopeptide (TPR) repeat protein
MLALLICASTIGFIVLLPYIITFGMVVGFTYRPMSIESIDSQAMPSQIRDLLQPWIDQLTAHDFSIVSYHRVQAHLIGPEADWGVVLQHSSQQTYVGLMVKPKPDVLCPVTCVFSSYWHETNLSTLNVENLIAHSENSIEKAQYIDRGSVDELWSGHQTFLNSICAIEDLEKMTVTEWINRIEQGSQKIVELRVEKRENYWVNKKEQIYRLHPWLILKMIVKIAIRQKNLNRQPIRGSGNINEQTIELEVRNYLDRSPKKGMSRAWRIGIFLSSFVLFIVVYAHHFKAIQLLIFIMTLAFHEAGHVTAMRIFGYRDTTMLFIPWFGALATGKKENSSLFEKVFISLAGPLPGLFLGILLTIIFPSSNSFVRDVSVMLVFLNLFNLLPIYPLDGGQVVNLLIFSRRPYLTIFFQSIGVLLLGLIGLVQPITLVFAVLIALGIPLNFRLARIRSDLRYEFKDSSLENRDILVRDIFRYLSRIRYTNLPENLKILMVDELLNNEGQKKSELLTRLGLSIFYIISLFGSFIGGLYVMIPNLDMWLKIPSVFLDAKNHFAKVAKSKIEQANKKIAINPQDISAYVQRGTGYYDLQQYATALKDVEYVISLDNNNFEAYRLRSEIRQKIGDLVGAEMDMQRSQKIFWTMQLQKNQEKIQQQSNNISAYVEIVRAKKMLGDKQGAIADYNTAVKIKSDSAEILIYRGFLGMELNEYQQALIDANQALELEPKNYEAYLLRAAIYEKMGDHINAVNDRKKAELLDES